MGPIPSEFGKMTNLRNLGLYHNFLQFELPSELGNLSLLKTLELQHNAIRGKVPTELGRLENLGMSSWGRRRLVVLFCESLCLSCHSYISFIFYLRHT